MGSGAFLWDKWGQEPFFGLPHPLKVPESLNVSTILFIQTFEPNGLPFIQSG